MTIGTISAICAGVLLPVISIAQGAVTNTFDPVNGKEGILDAMKSVSLYICIIGLVTWFFGYVYYAFWQHLAQNVSFDLRSRYLHSILRQEVAFFEKANV
jgi:ATP-binding cassette subfamily B (MDR/TAP) protein 1